MASMLQLHIIVLASPSSVGRWRQLFVGVLELISPNPRDCPLSLFDEFVFDETLRFDDGMFVFDEDL